MLHRARSAKPVGGKNTDACLAYAPYSSPPLSNKKPRRLLLKLTSYSCINMVAVKMNSSTATPFVSRKNHAIGSVCMVAVQLGDEGVQNVRYGALG